MKYSLILLVLLTIIASCSLLDRAEEPLNGIPKDAKVVPRSEYDKLMSKHIELSKKYQAVTKSSADPNSMNQTEISPNEIQKNTPSGLDANIDSVDVFAEVNKVQNNPAPAFSESSIQDTDQEVSLIKRAILLKNSSKPDQALKIFQALETSNTLQVKVRAKFYIGEILLEKKQYDLAMQSFESIVNNHAFSGMVIDSLRHLITCTDQLGIVDKKQKYLLMLRDVFGTV